MPLTVGHRVRENDENSHDDPQLLAAHRAGSCQAIYSYQINA
jgi:hypothetical protein